tara:strand:+ start:2138 stop:2566 length:429 start_codon:yes stop_codon:yes gene_type:complete
MVFYQIDKTQLPIIKIKFIGKVNNKELDLFLNEWSSFYGDGGNFYLFFDMTEMLTPNIKMVIKLAKFINSTKDHNPQYLKKSILIMNDVFILKKMVNVVFKITAPVTPLYIYWKHKYELNINNDTIQNIFETQNSKFQIIKP